MAETGDDVQGFVVRMLSRALEMQVAQINQGRCGLQEIEALLKIAEVLASQDLTPVLKRLKDLEQAMRELRKYVELEKLPKR